MYWMALFTSFAPIAKLQPLVDYNSAQKTDAVIHNFSFSLLAGSGYVQGEKSSSMEEIPDGDWREVRIDLYCLGRQRMIRLFHVNNLSVTSVCLCPYILTTALQEFKFP